MFEKCIVCRGSITPANTKVVKTSPLVHSYTAEGHTKAVLSVFATDDLLFSSSKGMKTMLELEVPFTDKYFLSGMWYMKLNESCKNVKS